VIEALARAPAPPLPATPYVGLVPYREEDADFFFGRERDARIVAGNLRASRLTILYGSSGVGKTSLLHAAVIHDLRAQVRANAATAARPARAPFAICSFSAWRDEPLPALAETMRLAVVEASGDADVRAWRPGEPLVDPLRWWTERVRTLLVILDQFEEYFLYHGDDEADGSFAAEFPRVVNDPNLRVNFILSLREDALAKLDRYQGRIPRLFSNYVRIDHLNREAARAAVEGPVDEWNRRLPPGEQPFSVEPALVEAIIDEVRAGSVAIGDAGAGFTTMSADKIETPYLQLVLLRLWEEEVVERSHVLRLETLARLGGAERIVRTHLDAAMARLSPEQQKIAAPVFRYLVTPSGTKIAHRPSDLGEYTNLPEADIPPVLAALSGPDVRILRPTADGRYEIYHDVLAEPILDWQRRYVAEQRLRRRIRRLRWSAAAAAPLVAAAILIPLILLLTRSTGTSDEKLRLEVAEALTEPHSYTLFPAHKGPVRDASFSRDGKLLVSASEDGTARIWRVPTSSGIGPLRPAQNVKVGHPLLAASFDSSGRYILTAGVDPTARVWDRNTTKVVASLRANDVDLDDASFSPDGKLVVTAGDDQTARVWDWRSGRPLVVLGGTSSPYGFGVTRRAVFSDDGRLVATSSDDGGVRLWDWRNRRIVKTFRASNPGTTATDVALYGASPLLVTAGQDGWTRVWDGKTGRLRASIFTSEIVRAVAISPDGRLVATQAADGEGRIWNWRTDQVLERVRPGGLERAQFSPDGKLVATASYSNAVWLWTVERPDLTIQSLRTSPRSTVTAVVANIGEAVSSPARLVIDGQGWNTATAPVPKLARGGRTTVRVPITSAAVGRRGPLVGAVNPGGTALESGSGNNSATLVLPDYAVETRGVGPVGNKLVVTVYAKNFGNARAPATAVEVTAPGFAPARAAVPALAPHTTKEQISVTLTVPAAARGREVVATATINSDKVLETDATNNSDRTAASLAPG
jgi:WD40 repeat protein